MDKTMVESGELQCNNFRSGASRRSPGSIRELGEGSSWDEVSVWSDAQCNERSG